MTRVRPHGTVSVYRSQPPSRRFLDLDPAGHVTLAIRRGAAGELLHLAGSTPHGDWVGVLPGGATHPLWGPSDRIVRGARADGSAEVLTVCGAVDWDGITVIPPLAEPASLPPGAGTTLLNALAGLAADQGVPTLRYRGPFPTEQLFWALLESFRFPTSVEDPLGIFLDDAEVAFAAGQSREAPLDWTPAPHERIFREDGVYVQLRDGIEKVGWDGRLYYRTDWQGLGRREHRVLRRATGPRGEAWVVAGLDALGGPVEDHLVLDGSGNVVARPALDAPAPPPAPDVGLAPIWRDALAALLPLEATPLLAPAIDAVWPRLAVSWGRVRRDLVEARGDRIRLSLALPDRYRAAGGGRERAHALVRDVLALVGPPVRQAAAAWLEAEPPDHQQAILGSAATADRRAAAERGAGALRRLLDTLAAGDALPPISGGRARSSRA